MRYGLLLLTFPLLACGEVDDGPNPEPMGDAGVIQPDTAPTTVSFGDPNLAQCVHEQLGIATDQDLRPEDLEKLKDLQCRARKITSLAGLEHAKNLQHLSVWENTITRLDPLTELTSLTSLQLGNNAIVDLTPLAKLVKLRRLGLSINKVDDLGALAGLANLEWLNLDHNIIDQSDLTRLAGLNKLRWLTVEHTGAQSTAGLSSLISAGAQVYFGGNADLGSKPDLLVNPGQLLASRGRLVAEAGPDGHVALFYEVEGLRYPTFAEYPGAVVQKRGQLRYQGRVIGDSHNGICSGPYAGVCEVSIGKKLGQLRGAAAGDPLFSVALRLHELVPLEADADVPEKNTELIDYVLASPNQFDAGSCLYMANTGAMEILFNQNARPSEIKYQGKTDLSERYLMNASMLVPQQIMRYSITDAVYTYNHFSGALLNTDYPFTAGYVKETSSGGLVPATSSDEGAEFSCKYNWIDELPDGWGQKLVQTPLAERTLLFLDPKLDKNSRWNVGIIGADVVDRIKWELRSKNAPVIVVYNHFLYWHASVIVGYDDNYDAGGCPMVDSMMDYFAQKDATSYVTKVKNHKQKLGGCVRKGVFYIRDSIYDGGAEEPTYSYSDQYSFDKKYSKKIIKRSYNWVTLVGNHVYSFHRM